MGSNIGQQTLRLLDKNWKSFFVAIKDYSNNKNKYFAKPNLPKYKKKDGRYIVGLDNNKIKNHNGKVHFSWKKLKYLNGIFNTKIKGRILQARIIPQGSCYILELIYEKEIEALRKESKNIIGIDLGVNNFVTIVNNIGENPIVINGKNIKSINQYYNKKLAFVKSEIKIKNKKNWCKRLERLSLKRSNKINYLFHVYSKNIIEYCKINDIDTIILGHNLKWKQNSQMSKKVNQKFIYIPYNNFINKLQYKAEENGISFITIEESYTSGTSFIDNELPVKSNYNKSRRKYRGLFESNNGTLINADVNGAYQIIKKVFPNVFANGIEGVGLHPIIVNLL